MQEKGKPVGDAGTIGFGIAEELGAGGLVDGVVDEVVRLETRGGNWRGVGGLEPQRSGLHQKVAVTGDFGQVRGVEGVDFQPFARAIELFGVEVGLQLRRKCLQFIHRPIDQHQLLAAHLCFRTT